MRLDDAVTYFLGEWPAEGPTLDTWRSYAGQLKWLVGFCRKRGKDALADLTPELLRAAMREKMSPQNHSLAFKGGESSAKALNAATRKMALWLGQKGVPVADLSTVRSPRVPERIQPRVKPAEFKAIEAAILRRLVTRGGRLPRLAVARDLALIYLLADTGLRANEVCGMSLSDIDFESASIQVMRGKGKKQRALSIADPADTAGGVALRLLSDWTELRPQVRGAQRSAALWISMRGNPLNREGLRGILDRLCTEAGVDGNRPPHTFRRTWFTESYKEAPESIRVLAARMGWSDRSHHMIDVYTRGAEIEIARTAAVASVSARWRDDMAIPNRRPVPIIQRDVGSERVANDAALPALGRVDRNGAAGQPARGRRPSSYVRRRP